MGAHFKKMSDDENLKKFDAAFDAQVEKTKANPEDNVHVVKGKNVYVAM